MPSRLMAVLFGGKSTDYLNKMQYNNFSRKVVSASPFFATWASSLPPIPLLNFFLVEFTIIDRQMHRVGMPWAGLKPPRQSVVPVMSTMNAAPDILLKVIHCNYCLNSCKTLRCSCRKMDYYAFLPVNLAKLQNVTIRTTRFLWRSLAMKMTKE